MTTKIDGNRKDAGEDSFNLLKAELFEALGHPTRIRLLETLNKNAATFSDLKRSAEIESNGLLQFHLGRLGGLVRLNADGLYSLSDEGKEELRVVKVTGQAKNGTAAHRSRFSILSGALGNFLGRVHDKEMKFSDYDFQNNRIGRFAIRVDRFYYVMMAAILVLHAADIFLTNVTISSGAGMETNPLYYVTDWASFIFVGFGLLILIFFLFSKIRPIGSLGMVTVLILTIVDFGNDAIVALLRISHF